MNNVLVKNNNLASIFDELFNVNGLQNTTKSVGSVPVNIYENKNSFELDIVAPGLNKEAIKLNLDKGLLTVSYEKQSDSNAAESIKTYKQEYSINSFKRTFTIEDNINIEGINAEYTNGILHISLPKKEEIKVAPKAISIK